MIGFRVPGALRQAPQDSGSQADYENNSPHFGMIKTPCKK